MAEELAKKKCVPCEGGMPPMTTEESNQYISQVIGWDLVEGKKLRRNLRILKNL